MPPQYPLRYSPPQRSPTKDVKDQQTVWEQSQTNTNWVVPEPPRETTEFDILNDVYEPSWYGEEEEEEEEEEKEEEDDSFFLQTAASAASMHKYDEWPTY